MFTHESARRAVVLITVLIATQLFSSDTDNALSQRRKTNSKRLDNSHFSHQTHFVEQKLSCESCHKFPSTNWKEVRQGDEAFPDVTEYPDHQSCLNCHRQQFFARERPVPRICSHCHVKATPRDTSRYPFPSLGEKFLSTAKATNFVSDFRVAFPHEKHVEDSDPKTCEGCHVTLQPQGESDEFVTKPPKDLGDAFWLKKGTFKTRPITHAGCFSCHNQESELAPLPPDCNACHKLSPATAAADFDPELTRKMGIDDWSTLTAWRTRQVAGTFRHEAHDMSCATCHDAKSQKVTIKSCGGAEGCHVTATTDDGGVLNYEIDQRKADDKFVCVKCHIVFGAKPVPASHSALMVKSP